MVVYVLENHETGDRIVTQDNTKIDEYENDIWKFYMTSSRVFDLDDKDVFAKIVELYDAGDRLATQLLEYRYAMKGV
jgi:hypothetical protein